MNFNPEQISIMQRLVGKRLINIFYQPTANIIAVDNMFVINFGSNRVEYSLHSFNYVRFRDNKDILLTSADEYFSPEYTHLSDEEINSQEGFEKSLIPVRIKNVKQLLKNAKVEKVEVKPWGDIDIRFDNGIVLEVSIDCSYEGYEYYRFIDVKNKKHYVVNFKKGGLKITVIK